MNAERLQDILDFYDLSVSAFEREIGAGNATIGRCFKGQGLTSSTIEKIFNRYPEINYDWFVTGRPPMFLKQKDRAADRLRRKP